MTRSAKWTNPDDRTEVVNLTDDGPAQAVWLWSQCNRKARLGIDRADYVAEMRALLPALPAAEAKSAPFFEIALGPHDLLLPVSISPHTIGTHDSTSSQAVMLRTPYRRAVCPATER